MGTLQEMGGCDIHYLLELDTDDPYYNPLFMIQQDKDKYSQAGNLDVIGQVYMSHGQSSEESEVER